MLAKRRKEKEGSSMQSSSTHPNSTDMSSTVSSTSFSSANSTLSDSATSTTASEASTPMTEIPGMSSAPTDPNGHNMTLPTQVDPSPGVSTPPSMPLSSPPLSTYVPPDGSLTTSPSSSSSSSATSTSAAPLASATGASNVSPANQHTLAAGAIAGITIGVLFIVAIALLAAFLYMRHRRRSRMPPSKEFMIAHPEAAGMRNGGATFDFVNSDGEATPIMRGFPNFETKKFPYG